MVTKKKPVQRTTVNQVSHDLDLHEQLCSERWKHNFEKIDRIEEMVIANSSRLWWFASIAITLLLSLVVKSFI
jgi:hypothetical protein